VQPRSFGRKKCPSHESVHGQNDETSENTEFLLPHLIAAADEVLEVGTIVISAVCRSVNTCHRQSILQIQSSQRFLHCRAGVSLPLLTVPSVSTVRPSTRFLCPKVLLPFRVLLACSVLPFQVMHCSQLYEHQHAISMSVSVRERTRFLPEYTVSTSAEVLRSGVGEQGNQGDIDLSVKGEVGKVSYTRIDLLLSSFLSHYVIVLGLRFNWYNPYKTQTGWLHAMNGRWQVRKTSINV
jgi:hypothetical protein